MLCISNKNSTVTQLFIIFIDKSCHMMVINTQCWSITTQIARFMGRTWGPYGTDRTQVGHMLAPWTLLSGNFTVCDDILLLHSVSSRIQGKNCGSKGTCCDCVTFVIFYFSRSCNSHEDHIPVGGNCLQQILTWFQNYPFFQHWDLLNSQIRFVLWYFE